MRISCLVDGPVFLFNMAIKPVLNKFHPVEFTDLLGIISGVGINNDNFISNVVHRFQAFADVSLLVECNYDDR